MLVRSRMSTIMAIEFLKTGKAAQGVMKSSSMEIFMAIHFKVPCNI